MRPRAGWGSLRPMTCAGCGRENGPDAKFCGGCGAPLGLACPACAHPNPPGGRFCTECGRALAARPAPAASEGERRQLTVMFCDLVGSTALSERLDPEELRTVVRAYQDAAGDVIQRLEGHVAQYLGDGLLAYFGYPRAHEDDARRAVRAGLEIAAAVEALSGRLAAEMRVTLAVRIGIHTGLVVVGEVGGRARQEQLALGGAPNVAARVQALAEPGTVVISGATARLVPGLFVLRDLGPAALRGVATPLRVHQVLGESAAESPLEAAAPGGLTPLVGREREAALLLERWERAAEGQGQVVVVSGEPGIGKSRLVQAVRDRLDPAVYARLDCRGSAYHRHSAFHPVIALAERALGLAREDPPEARLARLETEVARHRLPAAESVPLFAALLSLPAPDRYPPLALSAHRQRRKTLGAVLALLAAVAAGRPLLLTVEDLHWVDPSTLELLTLLVDQVPGMRVLALMTARADFRPPWAPRSHLTQISLPRLSRPQVLEVVARVSGGRPLPPPVVRAIEAKTDGVPLYVEELTKMVLESGLVREADGGWELAGPMASLAIPATLHDSLRARLDRLGPAKAVAQLGATVGREFGYEVLAAVAALDDTTLEEALAALVDAELLQQSGVPPRARYAFKHALVQEAAQESLLRSARQQHHRRIAEVLAEQFPDVAETEPELLAHHYTEAGHAEAAILHWKRAGRRASARAACVEAVAHLEKGLALLPAVPDAAARAQHELDLQTILAPALMAVRSPTAPEVEQAYARARELCRAVGVTPKLVWALEGLWAFYFVRGRYATARELGQEILDLAERLGVPRFRVIGHQALGATLLHLGALTEALAHLAQGAALYEPRPPDAGEDFREVNDPGVMCVAFQGQALALQGHLDRARARAEEAVRLARACAHPFSQAFALCAGVLVSFARGEAAPALAQADAALTLAREHGFPLWSATATVLGGWALAAAGRHAEGLERLRRGLAAWDAIGAGNLRPYYLVLLADACRCAERAEDGLAAVAEAGAAIEATGERLWEPESHRLRGELLLLRDAARSAEAEACFRRAHDLARDAGARLLAVRAALSLARRAASAPPGRRLLAEALAGLDEGFDTADLREARARLDAAAAR